MLKPHRHRIIQRVAPGPELKDVAHSLDCFNCGCQPHPSYACTCHRKPWCKTCGTRHIAGVKAQKTKLARLHAARASAELIV